MQLCRFTRRAVDVIPRTIVLVYPWPKGLELVMSLDPGIIAGRSCYVGKYSFAYLQ